MNVDSFLPERSSNFPVSEEGTVNVGTLSAEEEPGLVMFGVSDGTESRLLPAVLASETQRISRRNEEINVPTVLRRLGGLRGRFFSVDRFTAIQLLFSSTKRAKYAITDTWE